jgi:hypothetical protein
MSKLSFICQSDKYYDLTPLVVMSQVLRKQVKQLLKLSQAKAGEVEKLLHKATQALVKALSEIAYNITEGVVKSRLAKNNIVKILASKKRTPLTKLKTLKKSTAVKVIKGIVLAVVPVLKNLAE